MQWLLQSSVRIVCSCMQKLASCQKITASSSLKELLPTRRTYVRTCASAAAIPAGEVQRPCASRIWCLQASDMVIRYLRTQLVILYIRLPLVACVI